MHKNVVHLLLLSSKLTCQSWWPPGWGWTPWSRWRQSWCRCRTSRMEVPTLDSPVKNYMKLFYQLAVDLINTLGGTLYGRCGSHHLGPKPFSSKTQGNTDRYISKLVMIMYNRLAWCYTYSFWTRNLWGGIALTYQLPLLDFFQNIKRFLRHERQLSFRAIIYYKTVNNN